MLSQRDIGGTGRALSNCVFLRRLRVRRENTAEPARKIRRRRPDIIRTIRLGSSNSRLEASDNRIKVTIRMAYGFHHVDNLIALVMLRCGGLDYHNPRSNPRKQQKPLTYLLIQGMRDLWYLWLEKDNEGLRKDA